MSRFLTAVFVIALAPSIANLQAAEEWLEFRGPDGKGVTNARQLPLSWNSEGKIAWRAALEGAGWSSPVVQRDRIYLTSAVVTDEGSGDRSLRVLKLDAATGKLLKSVELFRQDGKNAAKIHRKNSHASPTPLVRGDRIYIHFGHQGTAAVDLDLNIQWKKRLEYKPVHGNGGTPILVGDKLIFSCDGASNPFVVALNANDGSVEWKFQRKSDAQRKFSFSTAQAIEVDGKVQVITPGSNVVCSLDPETGKEIWRVRYDGYSVIPRPVFHQGLVYICTGYNKPSLLAIRADGQGDVTDTHVAWTVAEAVPHTPSLVLDGKELYMVSDRGIATCLDAATGELVWKKRLGGAFSASPLLAGDRIYFQDEEGKATVIRKGREYEVLSENQLDGRTLASYAAIDGALFIRTDKALYRIAGP